jgi:hypothetical protein
VSKPPFDFDTLWGGDSERGGGMPAILLAADTHRRGKLHLNQELTFDTKEDDDAETMSQRARLHATFQGKLGSLATKKRTEHNADMTDPAKVNAAKATVTKAIKGTYKWMYGEIMKPALKRGLHREESAHYLGLAARYDKTLTDPSVAPSLVSHAVNAVDDLQKTKMPAWQ